MIFRITALQIQLLVQFPAYYASFCSRKSRPQSTEDLRSCQKHTIPGFRWTCFSRAIVVLFRSHLSPKRAKKYIIDHITCHILWPEQSCFVVPQCFLWHHNGRLVCVYIPSHNYRLACRKLYTRFTNVWFKSLLSSGWKSHKKPTKIRAQFGFYS